VTGTRCHYGDEVTAPGLSIEELAERTGEPAEHLREWQSLGLIGRSETSFSSEDIERARLIQLFLRRGIGLESIAHAERSQSLLGHYVETIFPREFRRRIRSRTRQRP
jgi:DNA-binding transcriptional MerR regulator